QAVQRVEAQVARAPQSAALHRVLGSVYMRRDDRARAETAFLKSLELDANTIGSYLALADLYSASGNDERALEKVNGALRVDAKNVTGHMLAGVLYERKGDLQRARQAYEQAV